MTDGNLGFCPRASRKGEKPCTFCSELLALVHLARAASNEQLVSSKTLSNISLMIKLCLSTKPLDQRDSAPVVLKLML